MGSGGMMSDYYLERRFGLLAVEKSYITAEQLLEAMNIQLKEDLDKKQHRLIGQILLDLGYIQTFQIKEILRSMGVPAGFCKQDDAAVNLMI
jgi:hypothetical protein